ncbi:YkgJ family cysteine cluster protein [Rubrivirga sp.]|uniref:YkgJ family cysteine cluster protein n=1 Tax=Rubrivirga sp. TaxID=1885344 RepID=UPI003C75A04F
MAEHDLHLLPVLRTRESAFSYTCRGCGRCCYHKGIRVGPYETARLADALGTSTTDVLDRYVHPETNLLRQAEGGACVFFDGGCRVHRGRPLACRLYPLVWTGATDGSESFPELSAHPETEGEYGTDGAVANYLASQDTAPYERAAWRYAAVLRRLRVALEADGADPGKPPPVLDVDAALEGEESSGDLEDRIDRHLELLHAWLDAADAPPST